MTTVPTCAPDARVHGKSISPCSGQDSEMMKLSGMLETIEARLAQKRKGELGHIEFLR